MSLDGDRPSASGSGYAPNPAFPKSLTFFLNGVIEGHHPWLGTEIGAGIGRFGATALHAGRGLRDKGK